MFTKLDDMAYQIDGDDIDIEQSCGNDQASLIQLHRWHISHLAELMGIVKAPADGESQKIITTLTRRLRLLRNRIEHLDDLLTAEPCDLPGPKKDSAEKLYSGVLLDLANEFCAELDSDSTEWENRNEE